MNRNNCAKQFMVIDHTGKVLSKYFLCKWANNMCIILTVFALKIG